MPQQHVKSTPICDAAPLFCVQRNGADYAVFINTGQEFDGSDSGARPDEAVSWGKIRTDAQPVKVLISAASAQIKPIIALIIAFNLMRI